MERGWGVRLKLDVQDRGGGKLLDVDRQEQCGGPENRAIFMDVICVWFLTSLVNCVTCKANKATIYVITDRKCYYPLINLST